MVLLSLGLVGLPNAAKANVRIQDSVYQLEPKRGRK